MRSGRSLALLLLVAGLCGRADAGEPWRWFCHPEPCPTCPDDYRPKPLPFAPAAHYCGPDDYCPKPLPIVRPLRCCGLDDYCPKPLPTVTRCYPPWYTCGPACHSAGAAHPGVTPRPSPGG